MNKVVLMGRLTKEPECKYTEANSIPVAIFDLAVNRRFVKQGEERKADFLRVIAWGKTAEFVSKYFKKGQQVGVIGRIETRQYDDKDGKRVYVTEVIAEEVYFADSKREDANTSSSAPFENAPNEFSQVTDDDLPF